MLAFPYNWDAKVPILLPPPKIPRLWHFVFKALVCRSLRFMETLDCAGFKGVSFCCPELQRRNCTCNFSNTAKEIAHKYLFSFCGSPLFQTVLSQFFFLTGPVWWCLAVCHPQSWKLWEWDHVYPVIWGWRGHFPVVTECQMDWRIWVRRISHTHSWLGFKNAPDNTPRAWWEGD